MNKSVIALFLSILTATAASQEVVETWRSLNGEYLLSIERSNYIKAIEVASELNKIDPGSTKAMLYMVFAYVKAGQRVPEWLLTTPWPNATPEDVFNRQLAETLANGS